MLPFTGQVDADGQVNWYSGNSKMAINSLASPPSYNAGISGLGWFNCDRFANFPGPFTNLSIALPQGYDSTNSKVFLAVKGEPTMLGAISTTSQYPIGLESYIIFVSEGSGQYVYAIKPVTLVQDASYAFNVSELQTASQTGLVSAINNLP
jgi:hypothetical protein